MALPPPSFVVDPLLDHILGLRSISVHSIKAVIADTGRAMPAEDGEPEAAIDPEHDEIDRDYYAYLDDVVLFFAHHIHRCRRAYPPSLCTWSGE